LRASRASRNTGQQARRWLDTVCRGWLYGGVAEDLEQHLDEDYRCWPLIALCGLQGRQWTRKGKPVPVERVTALVHRALTHATAIGGTA
jgi:hypothetical protein